MGVQMSFNQVQVGYTSMNTPINQLSASVRMPAAAAAGDARAGSGSSGGNEEDGTGAGSAGGYETCETVTSSMAISGKTAKQWIAARLLEKLLGRFPHEEFIAPPREPKERKRKRKNGENKSEGTGKGKATTGARGAGAGADADAREAAAESTRPPPKSPTAPHRSGSWPSVAPATMGMPMGMPPSGPCFPGERASRSFVWFGSRFEALRGEL